MSAKRGLQHHGENAKHATASFVFKPAHRPHIWLAEWPNRYGEVNQLLQSHVHQKTWSNLYFLIVDPKHLMRKWAGGEGNINQARLLQPGLMVKKVDWTYLLFLSLVGFSGTLLLSIHFHLSPSRMKSYKHPLKAHKHTSYKPNERSVLKPERLMRFFVSTSKKGQDTGIG